MGSDFFCSELCIISYPCVIVPIFILNLKSFLFFIFNELDELLLHMSSSVQDISYGENMEGIMLHEGPNLKPNLRNEPKSG